MCSLLIVSRVVRERLRVIEIEDRTRHKLQTGCPESLIIHAPQLCLVLTSAHFQGRLGLNQTGPSSNEVRVAAALCQIEFENNTYSSGDNSDAPD